MGENQLKSAAGKAALMPLMPPSRRRMRIGIEDAKVNDGDAEDVGQARRPQAADGRDADEDDGAGNHAALHGEDIRHEGMQNGTAGDVLQGGDAEHDEGQADDADDTGFFIVTPFKEFGNGRTVQGPVFAGSDETHDDGPNGPGGIVPAGCQADFYGTFSDADGRSSADGHAGNADGDQTRRKFTAGEEIFRRILAGPMFDIHGDGK